MKQKIRLTEGGLHRIVRKCVNEATKQKPIYPYHMQSMMGVKHPSDSVKGKFLRYSPEDSGFSSTDGANRHDDYNSEHMIELIENAMDSLAQARTYAKKSGDWNLHHLFNAILGELNTTIKKERGEDYNIIDF